MKPKYALRNFLAFAGSSILAVSSASAATLYWDGGIVNGGDPAANANGGAGNWNNALTNWDTLAAGGADIAWSAGDTAVFTVVGAGYTATLTEDITVGGLIFNKVTGNNNVYTINSATNSRTLSFSSGDNYIHLTAGNGGGASAAIIGQVAGTSANVIIAPQITVASGNGTNFGTTTFSGASTDGWTGSTTIGQRGLLSTVSTATLTNRVLASTSGITLNSSTLQFTRASNSDIDAISEGAISVNGGGTFSVTSSAGGASAIEDIGTVTVNSGQMNFVQTANNANELVLGGLSRGASTTSAVTFSSGNLGTARFAVTGSGTTSGWANLDPSNSIIGAWATTGTTAALQNDYAVYNGGFVTAANTTASAETTWTDAAKQYTLSYAAKTASSLSATRNIAALRASTTLTTVSSNTTAASPTFTIASGHSYAVGDVVVLGTAPGGFVAGQVYYVQSITGTTFTLTATPGGAAINATNAVAATFAGGLKLDSGINLGTTGILNSGTSPIGIGRTAAGGQISLPTAGAGNLFINAGSGNIGIDAPIVDNGGALTLVKTGNSILHLSNNNTFTGGLVVNAGTLRLTGNQSFTGGVTLNGGAFGDGTDGISAAEIDSNSVTVNGAASMFITGGETLASAIAINSTGNLILAAGSGNGTVSGVVSGSGGLTVSHNVGANTVILSNTANTHTGVISIIQDNNQSFSLAVNSLADSATLGAGNIQMGTGSAGGGATFALHTGAIAPLTLNNRRVELIGDENRTYKLSNNSTQAFTINSDLLASGTNVKTLTLGGSGIGLSTFAGTITNGNLTTLNLTKVDGNNTWVLSGTNSYTGATTFTGGTLIVSGTGSTNTGAYTLTNAAILRGTTATAFGDTTNISLGGTSTLQLRGDATAVFGKTTGGAAYTTSITATGTTINVDRNTFAGTNQTFTLGAMSIQSGAASVNTTLSGANNTSLILGAVTETGAAAGGTVQFTNNITGGGALTLASYTGIRTGTPTLQFSGVGNTTVTGSIAAGAGTQALSYNGTGILTLSGTNGYTGATSISAGLLRVNGSLNAGSAVGVSAGALGGTGTVNGTVTVSSTGAIDLRNNAVDTLTLDSTLNITGAAGANNLRFDLGNTTGTSDSLVVAGATTVTTTGAAVININQLGGSAGRNATTYTLIGGAGTLGATDFAKFSLATTKAFGQTYSLTNTGDDLQLVAANVTGAVLANTTLSGTNPSWQTSGNFTGAAVPDYQSNVIINSAIGTTGSLGASTNINSLTYGTSATTGTTVTPGTAAAGTPFNMLVIEAGNANGNTAGNGITLNNTSGTHTISANIGLAASQTWTVATGGGLTVSGVISDFGAGNSLTKAGGGTLTLSAAPTYTGATTITGGTFNVTALSGSVLPNTSGIAFTTANSTFKPSITNSNFGAMSIASGVTVTFEKFNGGSNTAYAISSLTGGGTLSYTNPGGSGTGTNLTFGTLADFTGNLQISQNGGAINAPNLNDATGSKILIGGGGSTNTVFNYTGSSLTLNNRQFELNSNANGLNVINNNGSGTFTINTNLAVTGTGAKTLRLGGTGNGVFGGNVVNGSGTLSLTKNDGNTWSLNGTDNTFTGTITVNNGTLAYASAGGANGISFTNTTGAATLTYTGSGQTMSGAINAGTVTSGTVNLVASGAGAVNYSNTASLGSTGALVKNLVLSGTNTDNNILAGAWVNNGAGAATLTKNGTGKWILSGTNNYTGITVVNAGTLQFANQASLYNGTSANWTAANINVKHGATFAVNVDSAASAGFDSGNLNTLLGNISVANTTAQGLQGGATLGFDTSTADLGTFTQGNAIANSTGAAGGTIGLTKLGTGTLVLDKANTYTGATTIQAGTLLLGSNDRLSNSTPVTVAGGSLDVSTFTDTVASFSMSSGALNGSGTLTAATYSLTGGTLAAQLGAGAVTVNGVVTFSAAGRLNATSSLIIQGGTLTLAGDETVASFQQTGGTIAGVFGINSASDFDLQSGTLSGNMGGNGGLTKTGVGTTVITGNNTYTGATTVTAGTLRVNGTTAAGSTVAVSAGATLGGTGTIGGIVNVSGVLSPGASIETLGTGTLSLTNGSSLVHELNSGVATAVGSDLLLVTGDINLAGTVGLNLSDLASPTVAFNVNDVFSLINYTGAWNGGLFTFGGNELANTEEFSFGLNTWRIDYNAPTGGLNFAGEYAGGSDSFVNLTVIPEPSSVALLGTLGVMMLLRRRRGEYSPE